MLAKTLQRRYSIETGESHVEMIPDRESFPCELLGIDDNNYIYIWINTSRYDQWYEKMEYLMAQGSDYLDPVSYEDLKKDQLVMVKNIGKWGNTYTRAKVLEVPDLPGKRIPCLKIDSFVIFHAHPGDTFEMPKNIASIPPFAVKCQLATFHFFIGINCFNWSMNERFVFHRKYRNCHFMAKNMGKGFDGTPVLSLKGDYGITLLSKMQRIILDVCKMPVPKLNMQPFEVELTHVEKSSFLWFQYKNNPIITRLTDVLHFFNLETMITKPEPEFSEEEKWKKDLCTGPDAVHLAEFDGAWYRATIGNVVDQEKELYEVFFIDYGNREVQHISKLFPARKFDENLCLIPPQCMKVQLCNETHMNVLHFWKDPDPLSKVLLKVLPKMKDMDTEYPLVNVLIRKPLVEHNLREEFSTEEVDLPPFQTCLGKTQNATPSCEDVQTLRFQIVQDFLFKSGNGENDDTGLHGNGENNDTGLYGNGENDDTGLHGNGENNDTGLYGNGENDDTGLYGNGENDDAGLHGNGENNDTGLYGNGENNDTGLLLKNGNVESDDNVEESDDNVEFDDTGLPLEIGNEESDDNVEDSDGDNMEFNDTGLLIKGGNVESDDNVEYDDTGLLIKNENEESDDNVEDSDDDNMEFNHTGILIKIGNVESDDNVKSDDTGLLIKSGNVESDDSGLELLESWGSNQLLGFPRVETALEWLLFRFNKTLHKPPPTLEDGFVLSDVVIHSVMPSNLFAVTTLDPIKYLRMMESDLYKFYDGIALSDGGMSLSDLVEKQYYAIFVPSIGRWIRCLLLGMKNTKNSSRLTVTLIDYAKMITIDFEEVLFLPIAHKYIEFPQLGFFLRQQKDEITAINKDRSSMVGLCFSVWLTHIEDKRIPSEIPALLKDCFPRVEGVFLGPYCGLDPGDLDYATWKQNLA